MKFYSLLASLLIMLLSSCAGIYKKQHSSGFTVMSRNHSKTEINKKQNKAELPQLSSVKAIKKPITVPENTDVAVTNYHLKYEKLKPEVPSVLYSNSAKISYSDKHFSGTDTLYRKAPSNSDQMRKAIDKKASLALTISIISIVSFWILSIFSLIPAFIALSLIKKSVAMSKINNQEPPSMVKSAKILVWITFSLNILLVLLFLFLLLVMLLIVGLI